MEWPRVFPVSKTDVVAARGAAAIDDDTGKDKADNEDDFDH